MSLPETPSQNYPFKGNFIPFNYASLERSERRFDKVRTQFLPSHVCLSTWASTLARAPAMPSSCLSTLTVKPILTFLAGELNANTELLFQNFILTEAMTRSRSEMKWAPLYPTGTNSTHCGTIDHVRPTQQRLKSQLLHRQAFS